MPDAGVNQPSWSAKEKPRAARKVYIPKSDASVGYPTLALQASRPTKRDPHVSDAATSQTAPGSSELKRIFCVCLMPNRPQKLACDIGAIGEANGSRTYRGDHDNHGTHLYQRLQEV
jgi:hypothetical protein